MYRLAICLPAVLIVTVLLLPADKSRPAPTAPAVHSIESGQQIAAFKPLVGPEEYAPDVDAYWMQPWYILCGFCVAACIFWGAFVARRDGWIGG